MTADLIQRIRAQVKLATEAGLPARSIAVEDLIALLAIAEQPADLPDEIVVHLPTFHDMADADVLHMPWSRMAIEAASVARRCDFWNSWAPIGDPS